MLAWRVRAAALGDVREYFVDAGNGAIAFEFSDLKTQSAVGRGQGVLGDTKKISVSPSGGQFVTTDRLRPPAVNTYDMRGNYVRTINYLNEVIQLTTNDLGADSDNTWTDGATVDAHVYSGWTYDYFFKRFNRRGLDNNDLPLVSLVHPVRRSDFQQVFPLVPDFYLNAGYYGGGVMVYGEGLPAGFTAGGQTIDFFSAALDVVAHELTHGVTDYTSNLIYQNESGALNEAFSDMMGTAVEFYFQQPGSGNLRADYLLGEDVFRPGGIRSMSDPAAYGDPDHYSRRYTGPADNGGVHINSGIANNAFYLAIEGGVEPHVRPVGAGRRRRQPRTGGTGVLPSVHPDAARQRDVRHGARRDAPVGARYLRRQQRRRTRHHASLDRGRCQLRIDTSLPAPRTAFTMATMTRRTRWVLPGIVHRGHRLIVAIVR